MTQDMNKQILRRDMEKTCFRKGRALLHLSFLLLMLCLGVNGAWGQTGPVGDDLSGYYYIANYTGDNGTAKGYNEATPETNYYLCPARPADNADENYNYDAIYYDGNNKQQPYLTTYRTGRVENAIWVVEFATTISNVDYYYIKYYSDSKYLTHNTSLAVAPTRYTVHLQTTAGNNNESLFCFEPGTDGSYFIRTQKVSSGNRHLNPATGNKNFYYGTGAGSKTTKINGKTVDPGGMIGYYTHNSHSDDQASQWYLEKVKPTISYNSNSLIEISISCGENATIYYTTDGEEPPTSGTDHIYSEPFDPADNVTTIKAVAIVNNVLSDVTTLTLPVLIGSNHKRLIQSQNNGWTIDENTDFHFYMIPGDEASGFTKVNTTSLFRPSMEWHFLNAGIENGIQYYYVVNNANSKYLCYDATNIVYMETFYDDNKFKFSIVESATTGTYNIIPYGLSSGNRFINKDTDNANANAINLNNNGNTNNSRWKFVLPSTLDKNAPFSVSDASTTFYYKINSVGSNDYIVPPSGNNTNATTSNSTNGVWYFEVAQPASETDWCTYYYIRNAETGNYLYFTKEDNNAGACLIMKETIESGNEDRYMFTWAKTAATEANYYIIPKLLKDKSLNKFSALQRDNGTLKTNLTRGAGNYAWTFTTAALFCNDPVFNEENGSITISCVPDITRIYYTTDGTEPNPGDETQRYTSTTSLSASDQLRIKAIAYVSNGTNSASSSVITLLNKPDITLEAGPYEYKGPAWKPSLLTLSIGESGSETIAPTSPATYTTTYSNNVNAGTATVTLTDADEGDNWYIWNGSTTFPITPKAITITADSDTKGYDGTPLTNDGYTCDPSLATGDSFESVTVTGSQTDVGSSYNVPSAAVIKNGSDENMTANYAITYVNGTLTVTLRSIGDGSLASGFTLEFGEGGAIILKDGEETLTKDTDYNIGSETTSESGKYTQRTVSGTGNYEGYFSIRNANVNFQNDGNGGTEYSATFVAENVAGPASNNSANGHALAEGITAYIITSISGNNANAEALEYIPEGIPVLLLSNAASGGFLVQDASGHTAITQTQKDNNMLEEVTNDPSKHFSFREIYLLYMNEFVHNLEGDLAKGKVYLNPSHSSGGGGGGGNSRLFIRWDTETGIDNSHLSPLTLHPLGTWYTLDGRRLNRKPTQKGLYLCNGQKTVVN